jgi:MFS transporter, SP family, xylose:H+ symportor
MAQVFSDISSALFASLLPGAVKVIATIVSGTAHQRSILSVHGANFYVSAFFLVDKIGRRWSLLVGCGVMGITMFSLGLAISSESSSTAVGWVALISLTLCIAGYAISFGPISWVRLRNPLFIFNLTSADARS